MHEFGATIYCMKHKLWRVRHPIRRWVWSGTS